MSLPSSHEYIGWPLTIYKSDIVIDMFFTTRAPRTTVEASARRGTRHQGVQIFADEADLRVERGSFSQEDSRAYRALLLMGRELRLRSKDRTVRRSV